MALFDPVDPRTESSLWAGLRRLCIVAGGGPRGGLPLLASAGPKEQSGSRLQASV